MPLCLGARVTFGFFFIFDYRFGSELCFKKKNVLIFFRCLYSTFFVFCQPKRKKKKKKNELRSGDENITFLVLLADIK